MLMTGSGALRNNLRALNQSLSSQVHPVMSCHSGVLKIDRTDI